VRLFEFEGKQALNRFGVRVPQGGVAASAAEAAEVARGLAGPVVVKAQVLSGGRGKAGGILMAATPDEASARARDLIGTVIGDETVARVLIEEQVAIARELYLGLTIDSDASRPVVLLSGEGGVEIEEIERTRPGTLQKVLIDVQPGLIPDDVVALARGAGLDGGIAADLATVAAALYGAFVDLDAVVAEINPLAVTEDGALIALDAKLDLDDYAADRQAYDPVEHIVAETAAEARARDLGLSYVELDGDIGIAGNGAGLMMATVDAVERLGGRAANFCDAGGARARPGSGRGAIDWWRDVIEVVMSNPKVEHLLFNLHGGNHRGDEVAQGVIEGLQRSRQVPTVVRLSGTREAEGHAILERHGITSFASMEEVVAAAIDQFDIGAAR
jgi:succinyl-CoA synthetase beta subunit